MAWDGERCMNVRPCALVVFGHDTRAPTIFAMEEATIATIGQPDWIVLARDSDVLGADRPCDAPRPASDAGRALDR
jgi:hypothetical protein